MENWIPNHLRCFTNSNSVIFPPASGLVFTPVVVFPSGFRIFSYLFPVTIAMLGKERLRPHRQIALWYFGHQSPKGLSWCRLIFLYVTLWFLSINSSWNTISSPGFLGSSSRHLIALMEGTLSPLISSPWRSQQNSVHFHSWLKTGKCFEDRWIENRKFTFSSLVPRFHNPFVFCCL